MQLDHEEADFYRRLFNAGPNASMVLTPDLRVVAVTDRYLALAMLARDEIVGRKLFDVLHEDVFDPSQSSSPEFRASLGRVSATHRVDRLPVRTHEISYDSSSGRLERRYARIVNSPVLSSNGNLDYILHTLEDVTMERPEIAADGPDPQAGDHTESARQLLGHRQQAVVLGERLRNAEIATAILGHDLSGPITALTLALETLLGISKLEEPERGLLRLADRTAGRVSRMVTQLLDLTRARVGGMPIDPKIIDVGQIASEVVDEIRVAYPGRVIEFDGDRRSERTRGDMEPAGLDRNASRSQIPPFDARLAAFADPDRVAQAVSNLVNNAIQHSGSTSTPVQVAIRAHDDAVELAVGNEGFIPADQLAQLFVPFSRFTRARAASGKPGLGLGLFIAREIAHAHGGTLAVSSSARAGTTFTLRLPSAGIGDLEPR